MICSITDENSSGDFLVSSMARSRFAFKVFLVVRFSPCELLEALTNIVAISVSYAKQLLTCSKLYSVTSLYNSIEYPHDGPSPQPPAPSSQLPAPGLILNASSYSYSYLNDSL